MCKSVLHWLCFLVQVRQQMEDEVAQKSSELEQYLQRVRELEDMYRRLEEALEDERQAKQDEEAMQKLQARSQNHTDTHMGMDTVLCWRLHKLD